LAMADSLVLRLNSLLSSFAGREDVSELKLQLVCPEIGLDYIWQDSASATRHLVASSTKLIAASIIQQLVEEQKLELTDVLTKHLPASEVANLNRFGGEDQSAKITVFDVLAQRSGIADYYQLKRLPKKGDVSAISASDPGWSYQEALDLAKSLPAKFPPGAAKAHYSATNYQIVGSLIEQLTGSSFADAVKSRITLPLGMSETTVLTRSNLEEFDKASKVLLGNVHYLGARRIASLGAEGAIISSTKDMTRFIRAFFEDQVVSQSSRELMMSNWLPIFTGVKYGQGIMALGLPKLLTGSSSASSYFGHAGATGHLMFFEPKAKLSIVGTINQLKPSRAPYRLMISALRLINSA